MLQLSRRDVAGAIQSLQSTHAQYLGYKGQTETAVGAVAGQMLSGLSAFGYGVLEGRNGPIKVGPVHADLLGAFVLHLGAFFGYAGRHQEVAHSIAQGFADGYAARMGMGLGTKMRVAAGGAPLSLGDPKGSFHVGGDLSPATHQSHRRARLTEAEIVSLVERAR